MVWRRLNGLLKKKPQKMNLRDPALIVRIDNFCALYIHAIRNYSVVQNLGQD
jgi:hypothetical protein